MSLSMTDIRKYREDYINRFGEPPSIFLIAPEDIGHVAMMVFLSKPPKLENCTYTECCNMVLDGVITIHGVQIRVGFGERDNPKDYVRHG